MLFTPKHPMTPQQIQAMDTANLNAVSLNTSSEVAAYILDKRKHLLNEAYEGLIERIAHVAEWERLYRLTFGLKVDLEQLLVPLLPFPISHELVVLANELNLKMIYNKCREIFHTEFRGSVWRDMTDYEDRILGIKHLPRTYYSGDRPDIAHKLLDGLMRSWNDYSGSAPKGAWVSTELILPHGENGKPAQPLRVTDLEFSRCGSLDEYLLYLIFSYMKMAREGKQKEWVSPHKDFRVWCIGSYAYHSNSLSDFSEGGTFHPIVYWEHGQMYIECSLSAPLDTRTGTFYAHRINP